MNTKRRIIVGALVVVVLFLAGFLPQFLNNRRLETELEGARAKLSSAQRQIAIDGIRTLAGRMMLEASRKNFGTAREYSTKYFDTVREMAEKPEHATVRSSLMETLKLRDSITSGLAQGDAGVISEVQSLLEQTYDLPNV